MEYVLRKLLERESFPCFHSCRTLIVLRDMYPALTSMIRLIADPNARLGPVLRPPGYLASVLGFQIQVANYHVTWAEKSSDYSNHHGQKSTAGKG